MNVHAKYKLYTNRIDISEKDKIVFDNNTFEVKLVDNRLGEDKILVVLLDVYNKDA
jgi:hypothetical protein